MKNLGETVTKLDAAERQLKTAIYLFFEERDAVSILTLAGAAHRVLTDLFRKNGKKNLLTDNPYIRQERQKEWIGIIRKPINFLKHAERDPDEVTELNEEIIPFHILDCICMLEILKGQKLYAGVVFFAWFALKFPHLLFTSPWKNKSIDEVSRCISPLEYEKWRGMLDITDLYKKFGPIIPERLREELEHLLKFI